MRLESENAKPGKTNVTLFFCHHTILTLPSINNETAFTGSWTPEFTGNSFLYNGYPVLRRAMETKRVSFPSRDNHRLHPPLDFCSDLFHMVQKDEAQVHCLRSPARPVCSAQQRKLICNLQWRQLNVNLLPLKSSLPRSCLVCLGNETKQIFKGSICKYILINLRLAWQIGWNTQKGSWDVNCLLQLQAKPWVMCQGKQRVVCPIFEFFAFWRLK